MLLLCCCWRSFNGGYDTTLTSKVSHLPPCASVSVVVGMVNIEDPMVFWSLILMASEFAMSSSTCLIHCSHVFPFFCAHGLLPRQHNGGSLSKKHKGGLKVQ
jgi:hypothetical protein